MSKKTKIIILITVTLVIVVLIGFLFFYKNQNGERGVDIVNNALPFGKGAPNAQTSTTTPIKDGSGGFIGGGENNNIQKLFQIHKTAVAGAGPFVIQTEGGEEKTLIRYLERGVGHIFETNLSTMKESRISNTTRLKIYEAVWGENGKSVIIRYLDDKDGETIRSFLIKLGDTPTQEEIPGESAPQTQNTETNGMFLPENIKNVTVSGDSKKIFYLLNTGDVALGTIYNLETEKTAQIFRSAFTEWLPQWPNKNMITLTTKPSSEVPGIVYSLDTKTERMTKVLGGIKGLTTLTSPDGEKVLYSESVRGGITLNLYNTKNHSSQTLPFTTLPEKCVWGNVNTNIIYCAVPTVIQNGAYPDEWYQGFVSFSDDIWTIDVETLTTKLLVSPTKEAREEIDAVNLLLDPNERYLFFTNKKDLSLWGIRI
jgi:hypothetical protein